LTHRLRAHLAAVLVGLLMLVSAAPCTVHAAAASSQPTIAAPADPCLAHHAAAGCACAQLACQHAADLNQAFSVPAAFPSATRFNLASATASAAPTHRRSHRHASSEPTKTNLRFLIGDFT
jgi:hypothetical protein